jgi:diguanylate cyclase
VTGLRILVVDDNALNRKLLVALLSHEGHSVDEAVDGRDGLAVVAERVPQLVISDILMPTMDGYEFVHRLRADPRTADLPVLFYTAHYHAREARALAARCGVRRVLRKPSPAREILDAVADALSARPGVGPVEPQETPVAFDQAHLQALTDELSQTADALSSANARLTALTQLSLEMASERDPERLLQKVCSGARQLLGSRVAYLVAMDKQRHVPMLFQHGTEGLQLPQRANLLEGGGSLGAVLGGREPRRFLAPGDDARIAELLPQALQPARAVLLAPLVSLTRCYGYVCLVDKVGADGFDAEDERLAGILSGQLGRIYENGSLYREVQQHADALMLEIEHRTRAVDDLRASEERFRQLAENIHDVFFIASPKLDELIYVSPGYEHVWGRSVAELIMRPTSWLDAVCHEDRDEVAQAIVALARDLAGAWEREWRITRPDGSLCWVLGRVFPIRDAAGAIVRAVGVVKDITRRKHDEARIVALNRTYAVLSGINSLIVRVTERDELLRSACRLVVEHGHFRVAWCLLVDPDRRALQTAACAGQADDTVSARNRTLDDDGRQRSISVEAVLSGRPVVRNDITAEWLQATGHDTGPVEGLRSMVALPLVVDDRSVGCLTLLSDTPDFFDADEMRLLEELAGDIAFALSSIDREERLRFLSENDAVTGLPNRRKLEQQLAQAVAAAGLATSGFALLIAETERLEGYADLVGRSGADQLQRAVAAHFAASVGAGGYVASLGPDRLAAILFRSGDGLDVGRRVDDVWQRWLGKPFRVGGQELRLAARGGVAIYPQDADAPDLLLRHAETALRSAPDTERALGFYTPHLGERLLARRALDLQLRRALEEGEFDVHYQPKVDLASRRVLGLEALMRWTNAELGAVSPATFIPLLEQSGQIREVGAWLFDRVAADQRSWRGTGGRVVPVAVNVSALQLRQENFVAALTALLRSGDGAVTNPARLDIEVTESVLMEDVEENLARLGALRDLGVGIALDDFGTGYSSLAYLARLPVNVIKIDRSFIAPMLDDQNAMTLVSTIISLARSMKRETVAEGVESEDQARILRLIGCDQMQGFLVSPAVPAAQVPELLERLGFVSS